MTEEQLREIEDGITKYLELDRNFVNAKLNLVKNFISLLKEVRRLREAVRELVCVSEVIRANHDVKFYDSDNNPVCHKYCMACRFNLALSNYKKLMGE